MNRFLNHRLLLMLSVLIVVAFASIFWIWQLAVNSSEPGEMIAFYRHTDFGYFACIARFFKHYLSEYMLLDSDSKGMPAVAVGLILPYSIPYAIFGGWGFWLGDILAHLFRLFAYYYLVSIITKDRSLRVLMATAFFFVSSEFVMGDYSHHTLTQGLWSNRIPRPIVSSSYLLLSVAILARLPELLSQIPLRWRSFLTLALPTVLLFNSDFYLFLSVCLVYVACFLMWFQSSSIKVDRMFAFIGAGLLIALPFLYFVFHINPILMIRDGQYPIFDRLHTIELPNRLQLAFLMGSLFLSCVALKFDQGNRPAARLMLIATAIFGASFIASPFFAIVEGYDIQEYHFGYATDQLACLLLCLWIFFLPSYFLQSFATSKKYTQRCAVLLSVGIGIWSAWICFDSVLDFAQLHAETHTEPEAGYGGKTHAGWRDSAREVLELVKARAKTSTVVFSTFDSELRILLGLASNVYPFNSDPFQTLASNEEIEERFDILSSLFQFDMQFFANWIYTVPVQTGFLSGGRYQMNRLHVFARYSEYPIEVLNTLPYRRDNWGLWTPMSEAKRQVADYARIRQLPPTDSLFRKYHMPDFIIVPREFESSQTPRGYALTKENENFRIYERTKSL